MWIDINVIFSLLFYSGNSLISDLKYKIIDLKEFLDFVRDNSDSFEFDSNEVLNLLSKADDLYASLDYFITNDKLRIKRDFELIKDENFNL